MSVRKWSSWVALGVGACWVAVGCSRGAPSGGPTPGTVADAGAAPPPGLTSDAASAASDRGPRAGDAGGGVLPPPAHGGAAARGPVALDGACSATLMPDRAPAPLTGTLPAPGPYRLCDVVGGQSFSVVVASTDGRRVAGLGVGGQIQVLDARTLALLGTFARARGPYTALAISADGGRIAAGAELDGELDVWGVDDHELLLAADLGAVWPTLGGAVAISADGKRAAASSGPDTVVADVTTGLLRRYAENRTCCTSALAFVDGGRKLASARYGFWQAGTGSGNVALIDLETGAETMLISHDDIFGGDTLAVSADGATVLTYRERVQVWDAATGARRAELAPPDGLGSFEVLGLNADGTEVAVLVRDARDEQAWFQHRRTSDGGLVDELRLDASLTGYGWSPAEVLLGRTPAAIVTTVDTRAARVLARACSAPTAYVRGFSRDGSRLLDGASGERVLDAASGAVVGPPPADAPRIVATVAMSPDGKRLAWVSFAPDGQTAAPLRLDVAGVDGGSHATLLATRAAYHFNVALAFSADGARLAALDNQMTTTDNHGVLAVFDVDTGRLLGEQVLARPYNQLLGFTADGAGVRIETDGVVQTVSWQDGSVTDRWSHVAGMLAASFGTTTFAVTTEEAAGATIVYRDGAPVATLPGADYDCFGAGTFVVVAPGGGTAAVGVACSRPWYSRVVPGISLYDIASGTLMQRLPLDDGALSWDGTKLAHGAEIWCR